MEINFTHIILFLIVLYLLFGNSNEEFPCSMVNSRINCNDNCNWDQTTSTCKDNVCYQKNKNECDLINQNCYWSDLDNSCIRKETQ
jgi:hypothetical protein